LHRCCGGYLNNRYYDPALSSFVSVDPLVGKTGTPYLYANGDPSTLSDPGGLAANCASVDGGGCHWVRTTRQIHHGQNHKQTTNENRQDGIVHAAPLCERQSMNAKSHGNCRLCTLTSQAERDEMFENS